MKLNSDGGVEVAWNNDGVFSESLTFKETSAELGVVLSIRVFDAMEMVGWIYRCQMVWIWIRCIHGFIVRNP